MKIINFPSLGLKITVNEFIQIGSIKIYYYAIFIVMSFVIALFICKRKSKTYKIFFEDVLQLSVFLIPISIISARIYYVLFNIKYYLQNPIQIFNIRSGGLAIYGGIIGGVIVCIIFCKIKKISLLNLLDYIAPSLALGQAIGRWGNFINGEAYGVKTNSIFRMGIFSNGYYIEVHPTFLYESICDLTIFFILLYMQNKRKYKGQITYTYLMLYGIIRTFIEGLRTDSLMLGSFRVSQIISIILFWIFGGILFYKEIIQKRKVISCIYK